MALVTLRDKQTNKHKYFILIFYHIFSWWQHRILSYVFLGVFKHYKWLWVYMFKKNSCCLTEVSLYFPGDILKSHFYDLGSKVKQMVLPVVSY